MDVWNTSDDRVQSLQMNRANQDRNFTFRQAFDVPAKRFVRLTDDTMRDLDIAPDGKWAVGRDARAYLADQKKEPAADFYRVNTATGERTLIAKGQLTGRHVFGISPHGAHFLYWKDSKFQVYDLEANATRTLGVAKPPVSFIDVEDDHPGIRPSYGIAGYTSDGKSVIVNHRYDLWLLPLDGSAPTNLTGGLGSKNEMRFRLVRTEPVDPSVASRRRASRDVRPHQASHPVGLRPVDEEGRLLRACRRTAEGTRLRGRVVQHAGEGAQGRTVPLHAADLRRVPRPAGLGPGVRRFEEDHRRQSPAEGLPVGPPRAVRLQEQGRRAAAGHPGGARRLQAGREAADDRHLLREELAEHARLHAAGLHGQHGPDAHAGHRATAT